jgi:hypothetical protein
MSAHDAEPREGTLQLNDEDIAYLMNVLRNATQPVTTQQLIDVLRRQSSSNPADLGPASGSGAA